MDNSVTAERTTNSICKAAQHLPYLFQRVTAPGVSALLARGSPGLLAPAQDPQGVTSPKGLAFVIHGVQLHIAPYLLYGTQIVVCKK